MKARKNRLESLLRLGRWWLRESALVVAVVVGLGAQSCWAWLRDVYQDETVVGRSDLIVVAAVKADSVVYVPHVVEGGGGRSWEHHVVLKISEMIKGECKTTEIAVTIDYGLDPVCDGEKGGATTQAVAVKSPLMIEDSGSEMGMVPVVADALKNNVWLLRADKGGGYHVTDPEDLQPLELKDYLACYLAKDPERAVRARMQVQPEIAERALWYLEHLAVQRILREPDPVVRAERLLPYFCGRDWWIELEARKGLEGCGPAAGPYLMAVYSGNYNDRLQEPIIQLWGTTRYAGAVDTLIKILDDGDRFWATEDLKAGWWNDDVGSKMTEARRGEYGFVHSAVEALGQIDAVRGRRAIEETRRCWAGIKSDDSQMVEACDRVLKMGGAESK